MRRAWMTLAGLALVAASCGSSGNDPTPTTPAERQAMIDLVAGNVAPQGPDDTAVLPFSEEGSRCFAEHIVDDLGVPRLEEFGYDTDKGDVPPTVIFKASLTDPEKNRAFTALQGCVDLPGVLSRFLQAGTEWPAAQADCVATRYLDSGLLGRSLFATGTDSGLAQEVKDMLADATTTCADTGGGQATTTTANP